MKSEDLRFMFLEMVQRTEQLFFSPVGVVDNRFSNLPSFLSALASIVKEMDDVRQYEFSFSFSTTLNDNLFPSNCNSPFYFSLLFPFTFLSACLNSPLYIYHFLSSPCFLLYHAYFYMFTFHHVLVLAPLPPILVDLGVSGCISGEVVGATV